jgi:hypothetical protein
MDLYLRRKSLGIGCWRSAPVAILPSGGGIRAALVLLLVSNAVVACAPAGDRSTGPSSQGSGAPVTVAAAPYRQAGSVEDTSYLGIRRFSIRIAIPPGHSRDEEAEALKEAAVHLAQREGANATIVFAYRPGDDTTRVYTVGRAIFAPNGRWEDAGSSAPKSVTIDWQTVPSIDAPADSEHSASKITCRRFSIIVRREGHGLKLSLDTDLPSDTEIMVSVERDYRAVVEGKADTYAEAYLEAEKASVADWRSPHLIDVADSIFRNLLHAHEQRLASAGMPMSVRRISQQVSARFTVPINQSNPRFGLWNVNLVGPSVKHQGSLHIIQLEKSIRLPLSHS